MEDANDNFVHNAAVSQSRTLAKPAGVKLKRAQSTIS